MLAYEDKNLEFVMPAWIPGFQVARTLSETSMSAGIPALHAMRRLGRCFGMNETALAIFQRRDEYVRLRGAENSAKAEKTARAICLSVMNTGVPVGPKLAVCILRYRSLSMTFKIERTRSGQVTTLRLIGRLKSDSLEALKQQIEHSGPKVVLDLAEVELVNVEAVRFLNACKNEGTEIANASPYIVEWMLRESKPAA